MDIKDVENLAEMARLDLGEDEKKQILSDMKGILEYVKVIEKVEVKDINPDYSVRNVWREDEVIPRDFSHEMIIDEFPDKQEGFLKVKKIL